MIGLTKEQEDILASLKLAVQQSNLQEVENIFNSHGDDIQAVLRHKGYALSCSDRDTILDFAIMCLRDEVRDTGKFGESVEIIKLIWDKPDQKTRDFLCSIKYSLAEGGSVSTISMLRDLQGQGRTNDSNNGSVLGEVIQEMEEHKRVEDLNIKLMRVIKNLNVDQVKAALKNCGTDIEKVLMREVYWKNGRTDPLLVFPLKVKRIEVLNQNNVEKRKEITKLLWNEASSNVRDFWLERCIANEEGQNTGDNYIIDSLEGRQGMYANIADEEWLEDFIQEVKDYKKGREEKLSKRILEDIEEKEPIADNETPGNSDTTFWSKHKGRLL